MITDVVFDLDDTLCDFQTAKTKGLEAAIRLLPANMRRQAFAVWGRQEAGLYASFASGKIDREEYRHQRFAMLLPDTRDSAVAVKAMNEAFMVEVNDNIGLIEGAVDCLKELHSMGLRCHLLTNGPVDGQERKIDRLKLGRWFDYIQIGEAVGVFKPDPKSFQILLGTIQKSAESVVMVGDSFSHDIKAAEAVGMMAVHFSRTGRGDIKSLKDLPEIVSNFSK